MRFRHIPVQVRLAQGLLIAWLESQSPNRREVDV